MMIKPATILNSYEFCNRTFPKKVKAAPKIIKKHSLYHVFAPKWKKTCVFMCVRSKMVQN